MLPCITRGLLRILSIAEIMPMFSVRAITRQIIFSATLSRVPQYTGVSQPFSNNVVRKGSYYMGWQVQISKVVSII